MKTCPACGSELGTGGICYTCPPKKQRRRTVTLDQLARSAAIRNRVAPPTPPARAPGPPTTVTLNATVPGNAVYTGNAGREEKPK